MTASINPQYNPQTIATEEAQSKPLANTGGSREGDKGKGPIGTSVLHGRIKIQVYNGPLTTLLYNQGRQIGKIYADNSMYVGKLTFINNEYVATGEGKFFLPNGTLLYVGEFENDTPTVGTYFNEDGSTMKAGDVAKFLTIQKK